MNTTDKIYGIHWFPLFGVPLAVLTIGGVPNGFW